MLSSISKWSYAGWQRLCRAFPTSCPSARSWYPKDAIRHGWSAFSILPSFLFDIPRAFRSTSCLSRYLPALAARLGANLQQPPASDAHLAL